MRTKKTLPTLSLFVLIWIANCSVIFCQDLSDSQSLLPNVSWPYFQFAKDGLYIGLQGGGSVWGNVNGSLTNLLQPNQVNNFRWHIKASGNLGIKLGRKHKNFRNEFEFMYIRSLYFENGVVQRPITITIPPINTNINFPGIGAVPAVINIPPQQVLIQPGNIPLLHEKANIFVFSINVFYDFINTFGPLTPFIGAGAGYGFMKNTINQLNLATATTTVHSPSFQGMAGFEYNWTHFFAMTLEYRYLFMVERKKLEHLLGNHRFNFGLVLRY